MQELKETIGRQALVALSNQYASVADALMELLDNPFDYRRGRFLNVEIHFDKAADRVIVFDSGGQGMGVDELGDWIAWGSGHEHASTDIGQYHVGGKLAAIYLAESLEIIGRRAGQPNVVRFRDPHWGSRTELFTGEPSRIDIDDVPNFLRTIIPRDRATGFTAIVLRGLKPHRYEEGILRSRLSNTYRSLLQRRQCAISINGRQIEPLDIPRSPTYTDREVSFQEKLACGVTLKGSVWITDRDRFRVGRGVQIEAGIRTIYNGRLITSGEQFGHYLAGRGSLQRLVGEIELNHIKPNTTKDDWDRDSPEWQAIHSFMETTMQPLVAFLNSLIEARPVSREQRKRAAAVRRSVEETLRRFEAQLRKTGLGSNGDQTGPGGRVPPAVTGSKKIEPIATKARGEVRERTEAPPDAVGKLLRKMGNGVPPLDFDDLGLTSRTQSRMTDSGPYIIVNTGFPLFPVFGEREEYLAESMFLHLLREPGVDDAGLSGADLADRLDELLIIWAEVVA